MRTELFATETTTLPQEAFVEIGRYEVSGTGDLMIYNTGGSSAGDGGMGSGSKDDTEKGDLVSPGEKSGTDGGDENTFDPIKKSVKEAEKKRDNEE